MKIHLALLTSVLIVFLSGCASTSRLTYTPEVRKMSYADNTLFRNLRSGIGGVGFADEVIYPDVNERRIEKIEIITPYNNRIAGKEKWTVNHDGKTNVSYLVTLNPDGRGGTYFSVKQID